MASAALEGYVNRLVSVITADGRNFVGTLKGFDQVINLILEDTHERVFSPNVREKHYFSVDIGWKLS